MVITPIIWCIIHTFLITPKIFIVITYLAEFINNKLGVNLSAMHLDYAIYIAITGFIELVLYIIGRKIKIVCACNGKTTVLKRLIIIIVGLIISGPLWFICLLGSILVTSYF